MTEISPVLQFLTCRTPRDWVDAAVQDTATLLLDHASLELSAAQQAQTVIRRYGGMRARPPRGVGESLILKLVNRMSRLAREELRHFEQVVALIESREISIRPVNASRYASSLHERIRLDEPDRFVDTLIVGAIIEARSCERFASLLPSLQTSDPELARFYRSLLRSEARHFTDYLDLAEQACSGVISDRVDELLRHESELILSADTQLRFHSGRPL